MDIVNVSEFRLLGRGDFWRRLWHTFNENHCWEMAAELAFWLLLAFFPFLIFLGGLLAHLPMESITFAWLMDQLIHFLPRQAEAEVSQALKNAEGWKTASRSALLWMGVSLWAASLAFNGLAGVLARAYCLKEERSFIRLRIRSMIVTVGMSFFILIAAVVLVFGDDLSQWALAALPLSSQGFTYRILTLSYVLLRWALLLVFISLGLQTLYFAMPTTRLHWRVVSPGSLAMTVGLVWGSMAFRTVANRFADYNNMYGNLGGLIVLMVWFYFCSLILLWGGQIDSTIFRLNLEHQVDGASSECT